MVVNVSLAQSADDSKARTFAEFLSQVEDDLGKKDTKFKDEDLPASKDSDGESKLEEDAEDGVLEDEDSEDEKPEDKSDEPEELPAPLAVLDDPSPQADPPSIESLSLADVIASLYQSYPEIIQARQEAAVAAGQVVSATGAYDTKFKSHILAEPTGFYETYRWGLGVARQTWWGGQATAGYRIGRGSFKPWRQERQTDDAGEFKVGLIQPLLQGRAIDPQRIAYFKARIAQQAPGPVILQTLLEASQDAAKLYWEWVSAGNVLEAQRQLLRLAEMRGDQFESGVKAGKFPEIDLILNRQLIAERRAQALEAEQKFQSIAFKLSLFLRDASGQPMVPTASWLPEQFPMIGDRPANDFQSDLASALARRPELQLLYLKLRDLNLDRQLATNELLPRLDLITEASQDMGEPASSSDDKGQFELLFGITSEVPIQRRKARGKLQATAAKVAQTNQKVRLVRDKIAVEIQTATNQLDMSAEVVEQTRISLLAALDTVKRYRFAFQKGKIDLIYLNFLETKANETQIKLFKSQENWFGALADLQAAYGLDPLEQAVTVSSLPQSGAPELVEDVDTEDDADENE